MDKNILKQNTNNVIWNIIGATLYSFTSFIFTIIVTRINGIENAGIFTYSYATACILFVIGIYYGRTFQVTDITEKYSDTDYIYNRLITSLLMLLSGTLFCVIKKYDIYKSSIFILLIGYKAIEAFSESIYGVIQKNERLDLVGKSFTMKALLGLLFFLVIDLITKNLILSCLGICIASLFILFIYDFKNAKRIGIKKTKFSHQVDITLFKIGFFTFALTFLSQYIINSSRYAIDDLSSEDIQAIFGYILMPATFMGLLGQFIIQPILTSISTCIKESNKDKLVKIIIKVFLIIFSIGIIALIVAYVLGIPVLQLVYGIDLSEYLIPLMIIILGSIFYSVELFESTVLIALRKTKWQAFYYLITAILSTLIAYILIKKYQILGASLTYLFTMLIIAIILLIYMIFSINKNLKVNED